VAWSHGRADYMEHGTVVFSMHRHTWRVGERTGERMGAPTISLFLGLVDCICFLSLTNDSIHLINFYNMDFICLRIIMKNTFCDIYFTYY
jgi:hypothetical protein